MNIKVDKLHKLIDLDLREDRGAIALDQEEALELAIDLITKAKGLRA